MGSRQEARQTWVQLLTAIFRLCVLLDSESQILTAKKANKACSKELLEGLHQITQKAANTMLARCLDSINNSHGEVEEDYNKVKAEGCP